MPEYTVIIKIPNAGNREFPYSVQLTGSYEDYPEDYFKVEQNRLQLCQAIQTQSVRQLSKEQLKRLIDEWIGEIKQSRRRTTITLDLPPEVISISSPSAVSTTSPPVDITTPTTTTTAYQPLAKKPNPPIAKPKTPATIPTTPIPAANINPPPTATSTPSTPSTSTPTDKKEPEPTISVESATNEADF